MTLVVLIFSAIVGVVYALFLQRDEIRRQEWRRDSRATWVKG